MERDTGNLSKRKTILMKKKALITGITGQDGAYLAEFLLTKGWEVFGAYRRSASTNFWRIKELGLKDLDLHLVEHDLTDFGSSITLLEKIQPDVVYNLAAQSFVGVSFTQPMTTMQITGMGALYLLDAIRLVNTKIRYYQASSSEMFGKVATNPQNEQTAFYPRSPYGVAKLCAHWMTINYRESYDIFGVCGILFNHESPLRGQEFVTRKITDSVAKIKLDQLDVLELGNLNAQRDWGFARDYVDGMYRMMQAKKPSTYVLATGKIATVRDFVTMAFQAAEIKIAWQNNTQEEYAMNTKTGKIIARINPKFYRPAEVDLLIGDASKAKKELGWEPKTQLAELCQMMVDADIRRNRDGFSF